MNTTNPTDDNDGGAQADLSGVNGGTDFGGGGGPDGSGPAPDLTRLKDYGEACVMDGECKSNLCKPLGALGASICVAACMSQTDCMPYDSTFCEASTVGGTGGYCVMLSPNHCSTCSANSDCGSLTERCIQAPGDIAAACHIDCSLAGAAACPPDYNCASVQDGGTTRKLCVPKAGACLDNLGGYCDRINTPQSCTRSNVAGACTGQRVCLLSKRYDRCNASAPAYLMSCADVAPAGCIESYAPGVLSSPQNCGACGNACPGYGLGNDDATCVDPATKKCGLTCRGENYDVNNNPADGCEQNHPTPPGHDAASSYDLGGTDCYGSKGSTTKNMLSDSRAHQNPTVLNFNGTIGNAPDYLKTFNTGGTFCCNNYNITFKTTGGGATTCYKMTFSTDKRTDSATVNGNGSGTISNGSGSWSDNTTLQFKVEKICNLPVQEAVNYTISYSLGSTLCF